MPEFAAVSHYHQQLQQWVSFVRDFIRFNEFHSKEASYFLEHSVTQLILLLMKHGPGSHQTQLSIPFTTAPLSFTVNAIKESYYDDWTLDQLADLTGLSKFQFAHSFKETFSVSPYSFLQLYRIMRSQEMLLNSNETILSIALSAGFKNLSSYNILFKRLYGKTPSQFRASHN
ncbi:AraC family transcriptional regulator [Pseudalkalibacillus hwajinpoensis]|uniref:AraC family transcriptional regulator n=1 Tax=Guptibacillus hwajinpoensis TaxID=208199 RepID=UPI00325B4180